jgi:hypothetical protein
VKNDALMAIECSGAVRIDKLTLPPLASQRRQRYADRFGKGRAREGNNLSSKGFSSRIRLAHNLQMDFRA